ncbi:hypothetical protein T01_12208 [Trichinella spiralis]|uniref:Uncharacterized protein n=2 Tax=Trichinella spiralis TaxID=6334 RepID=A0A0V1AYY1_TRISP|nr:hypothetical protein T01_12208 [Trichinella spiralis]
MANSACRYKAHSEEQTKRKRDACDSDRRVNTVDHGSDPSLHLFSDDKKNYNSSGSMVCNCSQPRKAHGTPCCALNERTDSGVTGLSNVGDMLVVNFVSLLAAPIYRDVQCLQLLNQTSEQTQ